MNTANFEKTSLFIERDYEQERSTRLGVLGSINDLGSIFVGHIHFKKLMNF